ncbi:MAG: T9SS type A sorting domain-containing protein, partial [Flavobacteriales bacterium]|nr:T9SS type A sorting domain-containing protein [Flavobacteriales bacterium]
ASSVTLDALNDGMSIYPNPVNGNVTINTGETIASTITIVDAQGIVVATLHPTQSVTAWDLTTSSGQTLPSGSYTIIIANLTGSYFMTLYIVR